MSSPEYEKFEMSQGDMDDIYNPTKRRRMSKSKATYGVWADDDSDDDDNASGRPRGKNKGRDYTAPINFISGGVKIGDKVTKKEEIDEGEEDGQNSDEDEEDEKARRSARSSRKFQTGVKTLNVNKNDDFASWEKHTKGFGSKILQKLGHVPGKGLGKNLQGFSVPVEAVQRKGRGAIGLYGTEKSDQVLKLEREKDRKERGEEGKDDEENEGEFKHKLRRWKKGEKEKIATKKKYLTAEELARLKSGKNQNYSGKPSYSTGLTTDVSNVKVIDMTGKEQRILQGYHAISQRHSRPEDEDDDSGVAVGLPKLFDLPELLHNLDLLIDLTEEKIVKNQKRLVFQKDLSVNLDHEYKRIDDFYKQTEEELLRFEEVMKILDECKEACESLPLVDAMEQCSASFSKLKADFHEEYLLHDLSVEIVDRLSPAIRKEFEGWDPLRDPKHATEVMALIKEVLSCSSQMNFHHSMNLGGVQAVPQDMDIFEKILWDNVMPQIRAGVRCWNVRNPNPMLEVLDSWHSLMPQWMISNLLDQFIYMKLQIELENWNPLTDGLPLQTWVHPWLFIMGDRMATLYPIIRQKLANALTHWKVEDSSARVILEPWVGVFNQNHMDVFVIKHILPKLIACLQEMSMSPFNQNFEPLNWVTAWVDIIPYRHMVDAIKENFFPKLFRVLASWVSSGSANLNDARHWLQTWRSNLPNKLVAEPAIKDCLAQAMAIINHAALSSMGPRIHQQPQAQAFRDVDYTHCRQPPPPPPTSGSLKIEDRIERICMENRIPFVPASAKSQHGHQVYKMGSMLIYFDGGSIYYFENSKWNSTTSIDYILSKILQ